MLRLSTIELPRALETTLPRSERRFCPLELKLCIGPSFLSTPMMKSPTGQTRADHSPRSVLRDIRATVCLKSPKTRDGTASLTLSVSTSTPPSMDKRTPQTEQRKTLTKFV